MNKAIGYLRLARPANLVTAVSDVLAGIAISGYFSGSSVDYIPVLLLAISTIGLYGGGVVFNDVFDAELDVVERPERAIPSGLISKKQAIIWGLVLLVVGIASASFNLYSFAIAVSIALAALIYDKYGKHHFYLGPLNMGICRGLNLLLGISIYPQTIAEYAYIIIVPIIYIAAITMISRGEVHGGNKTVLYLAALFYGIVITSIFTFSIANQSYFYASPLLLLFSILIFPALVNAIKNPQGKLIGKAVKAGVIALIAMNAAWAAAFGEIYIALVTLTLLPLSIYLGKLFAVT